MNIVEGKSLMWYSENCNIGSNIAERQYLEIAIGVFAPCRPHGENTLSTCFVWTTPTPRETSWSQEIENFTVFTTSSSQYKESTSFLVGNQDYCQWEYSYCKHFSIGKWNKINIGLWLLTFCFSMLMFIRFCDSFS